MLYSLMNKDIETLKFDLDESYIELVDNNHLPFSLRDYVKTTGEKSFNESIHDITVLRDYLASRTLNLSRDNAKAILNVANLPQSLNTEQRLKIVIACNALTMQDNFWIRKDGSVNKFTDVCLRHKKLSEASYDIAILGKHISATADDLIPDLTTEGMFPKYWHRREDGVVELWKTDKLGGKANTECEIESSRILDEVGCNHVKYRKEVRDGKIFSVCECMADDDKSFINAQEFMDWYTHMGRDFRNEMDVLCPQKFSNMCVIDYVLANTDRHSGNWGFMVNNDNKVIDFAPIYDMNQALIADYFETDISDQVYEPTDMSFRETIKKYASVSHTDFRKVSGLTEQIRKRVERMNRYRDDPDYNPSKSISKTMNDSMILSVLENPEDNFGR